MNTYKLIGLGSFAGTVVAVCCAVGAPSPATRPAITSTTMQFAPTSREVLATALNAIRVQLAIAILTGDKVQVREAITGLSHFEAQDDSELLSILHAESIASIAVGDKAIFARCFVKMYGRHFRDDLTDRAQSAYLDQDLRRSVLPIPAHMRYTAISSALSSLPVRPANLRLTLFKELNNAPHPYRSRLMAIKAEAENEAACVAALPASERLNDAESRAFKNTYVYMIDIEAHEMDMVELKATSHAYLSKFGSKGSTSDQALIRVLLAIQTCELRNGKEAGMQEFAKEKWLTDWVDEVEKGPKTAVGVEILALWAEIR